MGTVLLVFVFIESNFYSSLKSLFVVWTVNARGTQRTRYVRGEPLVTRSYNRVTVSSPSPSAFLIDVNSAVVFFK